MSTNKVTYVTVYDYYNTELNNVCWVTKILPRRSSCLYHKGQI